jgi:hypothetical protein
VKYKGKIEISKEEMDCLFGWLEKFIKLDHRLTNKVSKALDQAAEDLKIRKENLDDSESNDSEEDEDSLDWEDEEHSVEQKEDVHEAINLSTYNKTEQDDLQLGKKVAEDLFDMWITNLGDEEKEQPPRAETLEKLTGNRSGQRLYKYFVEQHKAGKDTTLMMREHFDSEMSDEDVRAVALHFTQVSSIVFHQLSDFLAYPNPLDED